MEELVRGIGMHVCIVVEASQVIAIVLELEMYMA